MTKNEFLARLAGVLEGIPEPEKQKALDFYNEMIDDRMEDGMTEEEAVASMESLDAIRNRIVSETPLPHLIREKRQNP